MAHEANLKLTPKATDILGLESKLKLAIGIIKKGGRTSIVRAVCHISKVSALQLHREIFGVGPNAGLLPYDQDWITKSPDNCLHASIYYNIHRKLSQNITSESKGEIFLQTYTLYEKTILDDRKVLNINRAWHIGQQISMGYISGKKCKTCKSSYVSITEFPDPYKFCPLCDITQDSSGRQRWKQLRLGTQTHRSKKPKENNKDGL